MHVVETLTTAFLMILIQGYRYVISPVLPGSCRYHPSCSAYALEAVSEHGSVRGGWLAIKRILRCHPWGAFGVDPVPEPTSRTSARRGSSPSHGNAAG